MTRSELIPILEKFGFVEITEKIDPKHWSRFLTYGEMPHSVKRYFKYKRSCFVRFDYINIYVNTYTALFSGYDISEEKVQSILFYLRCNPYRKKIYIHYITGKETLSEYFDSEFRNSEFYNETKKNRLLKEYEKFKQIKYDYILS